MFAGATRGAGALNFFGIVDDVGNFFNGITGFNKGEDENVGGVTKDYQVKKGFTFDRAQRQAVRERRIGRLQRIGGQVRIINRSFGRIDKALAN